MCKNWQIYRIKYQNEGFNFSIFSCLFENSNLIQKIDSFLDCLFLNLAKTYKLITKSYFYF